MLVHTAESGEKHYTVRAGSPRLLSTDHIREICEIADKYCDGHLRFTTRNNIEFLVSDKSKLEPLKKDLRSRGNKFPIGGTGAALDPAATFTLASDRADMAHFLRTAGYLFVRGVFSGGEIAALRSITAYSAEGTAVEMVTSWIAGGAALSMSRNTSCSPPTFRVSPWLM